MRFDEDERSPYRAAVDAMSGIASVIVTSTLVFMAVFVPVSFMNGTSGVFYTQFGITMAVAVGISAISASIMGEIQDELKQIPQIENFNMVTGFSMGPSGASHGMFIVKLKHWDKRPGKENSVDAVREEIYRRTAHIKNATLFVFAPPMIMGYGSGNNFEMYMQDRAGKGMEALSEVTNNFLVELNKRPEIQMSYTQFSPNFPQYLWMWTKHSASGRNHE